MRNIAITLLLIFQISIPIKIFSQELNFILGSGVGSYKMDDLKEFNNIVLKSLPFDARITNNFPIYWNYKSSIIYSFKKLLTVGITWSYQSTGSRVSRVDYSGIYSFDSRIRSSTPGIIIELFYPINKFRISLSNEVGLEFSKLRLKEFLQVNTETIDSAFIFNSKSIYYEPGFKVSYPISLFKIELFAGYSFDLKKEHLSSSGANKYVIELPNNKQGVPDWSGIRFDASLSFNLFQGLKLLRQHREIVNRQPKV